MREDKNIFANIKAHVHLNISPEWKNIEYDTCLTRGSRNVGNKYSQRHRPQSSKKEKAYHCWIIYIIRNVIRCLGGIKAKCCNFVSALRKVCRVNFCHEFCNFEIDTVLVCFFFIGIWGNREFYKKLKIKQVSFSSFVLFFIY
jgi:hypothetical protein